MANPQIVAYATQQNALFDKIDAGVAKVAADVEWQAKELKRWNDMPPGLPWGPEDQSILEALIARNTAAGTNIAAVDALVDDRPVVPDVPPVEPPPGPPSP